jgi:hypothetical protein
MNRLMEDDLLVVNYCNEHDEEASMWGVINSFLSFLTNLMKGGLIVIGNEVKVCS